MRIRGESVQNWPMAGILGRVIIIVKCAPLLGRELRQEKGVGLTPSAYLSFQKGRIMGFQKLTLLGVYFRLLLNHLVLLLIANIY